MIKEKKSHKAIINVLLIIGLILFCVGLYQIGTVSFLSTKMEHIDDDWIPAEDENSFGYFKSYRENDIIKLIDRIGLRNTIDNAISNPPENFEDKMGFFEDLKEKGYKYYYQFYKSKFYFLQRIITK